MSLLVVVVDDEPLARRRLRRLLKLYDDVEVVGEATNGDEAVSVVLEARPDALFMDVRMPGSDGL
jgi:two-component system LytT family response regulator